MPRFQSTSGSDLGRVHAAGRANGYAVNSSLRLLCSHPGERADAIESSLMCCTIHFRLFWIQNTRKYTLVISVSLWITQDINHRKVLRPCSVDGGYLMGVGASARGGVHVKLSDFNHIYDLKNERASSQCLQKMRERRGTGSTFWMRGGLQ